MANSAPDLGSVGIGFQVDLKSLKSQLDQAERLVSGLQKNVEAKAKQGSSGGKVGFLESIISGGKQAGASLSNLGSTGGVIGKLTSGLQGLGGAFKGMGASAGAGAAALGVAAIAIVAVVAVVGTLVLAVKGAKAAFDQLGSAIQLAVNQQAIETSFKILAQNMGISSAQANEFKKTLEDYNIAGAKATRIMQSMLNAQLPLDESTKSLVDVSQRYAVIAGTDTATSVGIMTDAIATLNPELLRQFGIVQTLPQIYDTYAQKLNVSADSLNVVQQRQAILNTIISQGARLQGVQTAAQYDAARGMQILKSNFDNFKAAIGRVALPTFTGLLKILVPISRQLGGDTTNLAAKMDSLGQRIASVVVPAFQKFINFVKAIPWVGIVDGAYRTIQVFRILASIIVFGAKTFINYARVGVAAVRVLILPFLNLANVIGGVAAIAAKAWQVITGKASLGDLKATMGAAKDQFVNLQKDVLGGFASAIGQSTVDQFNNTGDAIAGIADASQKLAKGFNVKDYFASLPGVSADAWDAAVKDAEDGTSNMSAKARKALAKLAEDLAKENADFARSQEKAARDYETSLAELVAGHRDQIASIKRDLDKENKDFEKAQQKRSDDYQAQLDTLAQADKDRKNDVQTQIDEELAKGRFADQTKIASLKARLQYEDAANKKAVAEAQKKYDEDTQNAKTEHDQQLTELQTALDKELAIQRQFGADFEKYRDYQVANDIAKLKASYAEQKAEDERAHAERIQDIIKRGAEEAAQYGANGENNANNYVGALAGGIDAAKPGLNNLTDQLGKGLMDQVQNGTNGKRKSWWDTFTGAIGGAFSWAKNELWPKIYSFGADIIGRVTDGIWGMANAVKEAVVGMFDRVTGLLGNLTSFGKNLLGKVGGGIKDALGAVGGAFQSAWNAAGFPHFARGGIVQGPAGVDKVTAQVSAGEMILNNGQQARLFNLLSGKTSIANGSGNPGGGVIIQNMEVSLPSVKNGSDFARELQLSFKAMRVI